jgi:hypothetical protein
MKTPHALVNIFPWSSRNAPPASCIQIDISDPLPAATLLNKGEGKSEFTTPYFPLLDKEGGSWFL